MPFFIMLHISNPNLHILLEKNMQITQMIERYGKYGNCPDCGTPLDDDNVGGNGFCINCAPDH